MDLAVRPIPHAVAVRAVVAHHYLHRRPAVSHALGLIDGSRIRGVITLGTPASRHLQTGVCPTDPARVIELNRMWIDDAQPWGQASWFIARALRTLPPLIVVSYADTTFGHLGYVYRAANFRYGGWTDMDRATPRYDYVPLHVGAHTREASRSGYSTRVRRRPKVRYWTTTGNRADRRRLAAACRWPDLDWAAEPPPVEHRRRTAS